MMRSTKTMMIPRGKLLVPAVAMALCLAMGRAGAASWQQTVNQARGQTVFFNAWGGSEQTNDYIDWAARQVKQRYGISLKHVKVSDVSGVVSRILAEKAAGRNDKGTVDLLWINGENFQAMKNNSLLFGPFVAELPAFQGVDPEQKPTTVVDFGEPVDGLEAPWGMAQLVFIYDQETLSRLNAKPPTSATSLLEFARKHKGQVTYPLPPDFTGTTFLKQLLIELTPESDILSKPVHQADFTAITAPLWRYLDELHPLLWREGKTFPANVMLMTPMLDDGEILLSMSFNPAYASAAINSGELPNTVRTYIHDNGTIGNTHFLAIPFNSSATAAARVVINFLLSPEAQALKANPDAWGDPTVLSLNRLTATQRKLFSDLPVEPATLPPEALTRTLAEPHGSWTTALEKAWLSRYR